MSQRPNSPPPPLPPRGLRRGKPAAPVKTHGRGLAPEKKLAQQRNKASRRCLTAFYAGIAGFVFMVVPFAPPGLSAGAGLVALIWGSWGLSGLQNTGLGPGNVAEVSPIERVSSRLARRAKPMGGTGIACGVALVGLTLVMLYLRSR